MVTRVGAPGHEGWLYLVVNASMKDADYAHIQARLPKGVTPESQGRTGADGPAGTVRRRRAGKACARGRRMSFMMSADVQIDGIWCHVSRSGYTGEDGYEISCQGRRMRPKLWRTLARRSRR